MTIGFHSPLPPARTGVADYSAVLLDHLSRRASVIANPDRACDVELYHLGNNQLHRPMYERAVARPGAVVLHDAVLNHFFLGHGDEKAYVEEFVHCYGEWHRGLAQQLWQTRAQSAQRAEYFHYGMLRGVAERSRAVIVHNPGAARRVREEAPDAAVIEIPHLYAPVPPPPASEIEALRATLGGARFLFGVFGHLRESKRLMAILNVFSHLRRQDAGLGLLVAGPFGSSDLERACAPLLRQPGVVRVDYLPEADFLKHAHLVDCCVNLREPPAGETSGIAIRLMAIGKPVILTGGEETAHFPAGTCIPIDAGIPAAEMLAAAMLWLSRNPEDARGIGAAAATYIERCHGVDRVCELYLRALRTIV